MSKSLWLAVGGVLVVVGGFAAALVSSQPNITPLPPAVSGIVLDTDGPVADAIVQVQGTPDQLRTAENGTFTLTGLGGTEPVVVTAWSEGHYIGWATLDPAEPNWENGIDITLRPISQRDNSEYEWFSFEEEQGSAACGLCHREYEEWQVDQHARAAINHRFLNLYTGTDVNGQEGQMTQWGSDGLPRPLDPTQPHYGPGFMLDNPGRAGNCATCHTPMASKAPNNKNCGWSGCHTSLTIERANGLIDWPAMPVNLRGDAAEGISCEFCHKTSDVMVNPETNLPREDMPGILSMKLHRPADAEHQVFFGTLVDVNRKDDSYLPLLSESRFCASCHHGVMGGVVGNMTVTGGVLVYSSYSEWLDSPYSDPETGQTCQDCHMPVSDANRFVTAERGGLERDYVELHNHTMRGAADEDFLQNAVTMTSSAQVTGGQLEVEVSITNDQTGHHIPTDAVIRSMILVVEAQDSAGNLLTLAEGPVNPDFSGDYGGLPGKTFARVLRDEWSGETPTAAFWRTVSVVEDSRIPALATDTTRYTFAVPAGEDLTVNIRLIFRRAFYDLMQQKGWNDPDILMEQATLHVPAT